MDTDSTMRSVKGVTVASPSSPMRVATLDKRHSTKWPIVIWDGVAWGLMMISGTMAFSTVSYTNRTLWLCQDANLSLICGIREDLTMTFTNFWPSEFVVMSTRSMISLCGFQRRRYILARVRPCTLAELFAVGRDGCCFANDDIFACETSTQSNQTIISNLSYVPCFSVR